MEMIDGHVLVLFDEDHYGRQRSTGLISAPPVSVASGHATAATAARQIRLEKDSEGLQLKKAPAAAGKNNPRLFYLRKSIKSME
jgi:hypothetical protein